MIKMDFTRGEVKYLSDISERITRLQQFLGTNKLDSDSKDIRHWYNYLTQIKRIVGNRDNDISFIASLMAKMFLTAKHNLSSVDMSTKPQSAPGLDIDEITPSGERIIAEIKTTIPYGKTDLGAQQKSTFRKDFDKLSTNNAKHKYFFLTEAETFKIVKKRYLKALHGVTIVLLPEGFTDENYIIENQIQN